MVLILGACSGGTGMQTTIEGPLTGPRQKGLDVSSFHPQRLRNFVNLFMPSYAWLLRPQVGESHPVQCKSKKNSSSKLSEHMAIGYYSSNIDMLGTPRLLRYIFVFFYANHTNIAGMNYKDIYHRARNMEFWCTSILLSCHRRPKFGEGVARGRRVSAGICGGKIPTSQGRQGLGCCLDIHFI
jgi:hypothetical protein